MNKKNYNYAESRLRKIEEKVENILADVIAMWENREKAGKQGKAPRVDAGDQRDETWGSGVTFGRTFWLTASLMGCKVSTEDKASPIRQHPSFRKRPLISKKTKLLPHRVNHSAKVKSLSMMNSGADRSATATDVNKYDFEFMQVLGQGGFGTVVASRLRSRDLLHHSSQQDHCFAIKEMKKSKIMDTRRGQEMIQNEFYALKALSNPFIVGLAFAFQDRSSCFLALHLYLGGDLRQYLQKGYIFTEEDVALYCACLGSALNYMHHRGIVHRDIKPENILLDSRGYPHLTDFGVPTSSMIRTLHFCAPLALAPSST